MKSLRQLNTLSNLEVINLVNIVLPHVELLAHGGSATYRMIEFKLSEHSNELLCRVTYKGIFKDEAKEVTVFSIQNSVNDVTIYEYVSGCNNPETVKDFGITGEYCDIFIGAKKLYNFLNDILKCWNPEQATNQINASLKSCWQIIEEYSDSPSTEVFSFN